MPFGLVLGDDKKKFKTRSGEVTKLVDLLDEVPSSPRYRGTSLIRNCFPLGPYGRPVPRALWWS